MEATASGADRAAGMPRRGLLAMWPVGAIGVAAVSGCTVYGDQPDPPPPPPPDRGGNDGDGDSGSGSGGGTPVVGTADVPVGGGVIDADLGVVVTQPAAGEFKGFSSTCTHQGCTVAEVAGGTINCPCHGARFSAEDGSVVQAAQGLSPDQQSPLPQVRISVDGDTVMLT